MTDAAALALMANEDGQSFESVLIVRITPGMKSELEQLAERRGLSLSDVVRAGLTFALDAFDEGDAP